MSDTAARPADGCAQRASGARRWVRRPGAARIEARPGPSHHSYTAGMAVTAETVLKFRKYTPGPALLLPVSGPPTASRAEPGRQEGDVSWQHHAASPAAARRSRSEPRMLRP